MTPSSSALGENQERDLTTLRQILRNQRELEEKRKFGLAPLAVDTITKNEISPNVPQSIVQAPWYYGIGGPTLEHQRKRDSDGNIVSATDDVLSSSAPPITVLGKQKRFVAGTCKNCGSHTHKTHECFQTRKKLRAEYSGVVTGLDIQVTDQVCNSKKTYAQKRDRFAGDVGIDFLHHAAPAGDEMEDSAGRSDACKQSRHEDAFAPRAAQHGGTEIQELPKYLQNLDQQNDVFFDPKTGSMRDNPNACEPTKLFQGDLQRYRSGDYYNYIESQYRYLTGKSKSFVDFALDDSLQHQARGGSATPKVSPGLLPSEVTEKVPMAQYPQPPSAVEVLVHSLYGGSVASSNLPCGPQAAVAVRSPAPAPTELILEATKKVTESQTHSRLMQVILQNAKTYEGHASCFGSYFDTQTFSWGFACCRRCGDSTLACVANNGAEGGSACSDDMQQ